MEQSVKGVAVRAGLHWVATTYGVDTVQKVHDRGSPGLRATVIPGLASFGILSTGWYETAVISELLDVIVEVTTPPSVEEHFARMADAVATDNVNGVYRTLFRLIATRPLLLMHAQRVWGSYFSDGELVVTSAREGEFVFHACDGETHHTSLCMMTSLVLERILKLVGYKGATLERKQCRGQGAPECVFEVDYVT
jgi:hypothetical protein